ncbi:MAG: hypothetical protein KC613_00230 [Myxococcales bacterium]|nr:hypothetical protein [Myxococcales bacterium]MCB9525476.1 hypothetical protein [Myxococcales bacterium]
MIAALCALAALLAPVGPPPEAEPPPEEFGVVGFPLIAYAPETSALAALVGVVFLPGSGPRPSSARLTAVYTLQHQAAVVFDPTLSFADGDWEVEGRVSAIRWRFPFQGFDGQAPRRWYTQPAFSAEMVISRRILGNFYAGVGGSYSLTEIDFGRRPPPQGLRGLEGGSMGGASAELRYDSRDHQLTPTRGMRYLARFEGRPPFASDFPHNRVTTEARAFFGDGRHVLGLQAMWYGIWGDAPFFNLNTFGGQSEMRGVFRDRYRNTHSAFAQAEYRSPPVYWRVGFAGFGGVAATFGELGPFTPTWSLGAGVRVLLSEARKINLRVDGALARGEHGAYLGLGEAF